MTSNPNISNFVTENLFCLLLPQPAGGSRGLLWTFLFFYFEVFVLFKSANSHFNWRGLIQSYFLFPMHTVSSLVWEELLRLTWFLMFISKESELKCHSAGLLFPVMQLSRTHTMEWLPCKLNVISKRVNTTEKYEDANIWNWILHWLQAENRW